MTTTARSDTPASPAPRESRESRAPLQPVAPGSRVESLWLALRLAGDLLSTPFHLVGFFCTRGRQRRALLDALREAAR